MRSFSNAPRGSALGAVTTVEVAEWSPESLFASGSPSARQELRGVVLEAVEAALAAEREEAAAREEELLAIEAERRDAAVREAYQRGYAEGRDMGEQAEAARLRSATAAAEEVLDTLREGEIRWTGTIEENVCALAVTIARQIIGREMQADAETFADLIRNALREFPIDQPIRIRLNPGDLNALSSVAAVEVDPMLAITGDREARWFPDSSIAPGGCMVEGRERIIDGRVDTALERIYRRLTYTNA